MTSTVKTTQTGEEGSIHCTDSVQTLNQRTLLHPVYLKYSETEYWAENKTDSIPGTGYSLKPACGSLVFPHNWSLYFLDPVNLG